MLQMIFSPPGCGKTYEIHRRIKQRCDGGLNDSVLIVPEQSSFETERNMLRLLGADGLEKIEVLSFSRFCEKFFAKYGGQNKKRIDESAMSALMQYTLRRLQKSLKVFAKSANSSSFAELLLKLNEQMKRFCVTEEMLQARAQKEHGLLKAKLEEVAMILSEYEQGLNEEYFDPADNLTKAAKMLCENRYFAGKTVFLDSFNGFTAQQLLVIEQIIRQADDTVMTLCLDKNCTALPQSVYAAMNDTAEKIKQIAKKCNVKILPDITLSGFSRYKNAGLAHLSQNAFMPDSSKYDGVCENIEIAVLDSIYDECDYVAANICRLVREDGVRYREIAVIARDTQRYSGIIERAMTACGIPCFIDAKKSALGTAMLRFVRNAMSAAKNYSTESILATLKTGIANVNQDEVMLLDNYTAMWSIDNDDWLSDFTMDAAELAGTNGASTEEILTKLNNLRSNVIKPLKSLHDRIQSGGAKNISAAIYQFIVDMKANEGLNSFCKSLEKDGQISEADVQRSAYDLVIRLLDQMVMALDKFEIDFVNYCEIFDSAAAAADIGKLPQGLDEVAIGSAQRMRPSSPKITFIIGANDGVFPSVFNETGIFSDAELDTLKNAGIELPVYDEQRAAEENFLAFTAMCSPSEKLFVSCIGSDSDGRQLRPSSIVHELQRLFTLDENARTGIEEIESSNQALKLYSENFHDNSIQKSTLEKYFTDEKSAEFELIKNAQNGISAKLSPDTAKELFGKDLHLSASRIDTFYHCSFEYFCQYGLKILPMKKMEIDNLSRGTVIHEMLCKFITKYPDADEYDKLGSEQIFYEIRKIVDEELGEASGTQKSKNIMKYRINSLVLTMKNVLDIVYDEIRQTDYKVEKAELSFGSGEDYDGDEITYKLDSGGEIRICGQIDRVDSYTKPDGEKYIRVIDYKTGSNEFKLSDVVHGLNLQMLLYLVAYKRMIDKDITPGGVLYMRVRDSAHSGESKTSLTAAQIRSQRRKNMKMNGIVLDDRDSMLAMEPELSGEFTPIKAAKDGRIVASSVYSLGQFELLARHLDKMIVQMGNILQSGEISVNPLDGNKSACEYCNYKDVCRHEGKCSKVPKMSDSDVLELLENEHKANGKEGENNG